VASQWGRICAYAPHRPAVNVLRPNLRIVRELYKLATKLRLLAVKVRHAQGQNISHQRELADRFPRRT